MSLLLQWRAMPRRERYLALALLCALLATPALGAVMALATGDPWWLATFLVLLVGLS